MGWDFGAGVAAAAGAGAGLIGDSIKRERDLQGATDLEALKQKIEQEKQARIAAIVGGVSRTKDVAIAGPTEDGSSLGMTQKPKDETEYLREVGDKLTGAGIIDQGGKFYDRADKHADRETMRTTQAAAQKSADERWRATEARQDKVWEETVRHNTALEAKAGADRISPAARAQLEMASTYVNSAHRVEAEAAKALEAGRKDSLATPEKIKQLETDYQQSKTAVVIALKQYDQIGAAHFGEQWKKTETVAPAVTGGGAGKIVYGTDGKIVRDKPAAADAPTAPAKPTAPASGGNEIQKIDAEIDTIRTSLNTDKTRRTNPLKGGGEILSADETSRLEARLSELKTRRQKLGGLPIMDAASGIINTIRN